MSDHKIENNACRRKADFFEQLNLSESAARNYRNVITSSFLKEILKSDYEVEEIFEITNLDTLWKLYSYINSHPKNVNTHRAYSAAIMKYIRFLNNGNKYGKRIDFGKARVTHGDCHHM